MSIDSKQIIHIASEIVVIGGITAYFMNKTSKLTEQIDELEIKLVQHEEVIRNHENLLLKLLNAVNEMQLQIQQTNQLKQQLPKQEVSKQQKVKQEVLKQQLPKQELSKQQLPKEEVSKQQSPVQQYNNNPVISHNLPQNLMSSRQVMIMIPSTTFNNENEFSESKIEEINDECNDDMCSTNTLDRELEEELKDLILNSEPINSESINSEPINSEFIDIVKNDNILEIQDDGDDI